MTIWRGRSAGKWVAGFAGFLSAITLIAVVFRVAALRQESEDCRAIYQSIMRPHHGDRVWMKRHVLLKNSGSTRYIANAIAGLLDHLPSSRRAQHWWELRSFLQQADGQPLPYSINSEPGLRVIEESQKSTSLDRGLTVLSFTHPGFSFLHRKAVVFIGAESKDRRLASSFEGSLLYFQKIGGRWIRDDFEGLLRIGIIA